MINKKTIGLKADLHLHTSDCKKESTITYNAFQLIDRAAEKGFDVLSITNHDTITFSRRLEDYAEQKGILLLPGVELTINRKHVLAYNLSCRIDKICGFNDLKRLKNPKTLFIAPHPFFPSPASLGRDFIKWIDIFDAVELSHFYTRKFNFNKKALEAAERNNLPVVGSSDCHVPRQLGTTYSLIHAEKDRDSIIKAIKRGNVMPITKPLKQAQACVIMRDMLLMKSLQKLVSMCPCLLPLAGKFNSP